MIFSAGASTFFTMPLRLIVSVAILLVTFLVLFLVLIATALIGVIVWSNRSSPMIVFQWLVPWGSGDQVLNGDTSVTMFERLMSIRGRSSG